MENLTAQELYAQLYDVYVSDWPGEVEFYYDLIAHSSWMAKGVLEIACGTGRIALRFAREGVNITGLDISAELLAKAQEKSSGMSNVRWIQGDMRTFEIGTKFGCVIMPGHSFQILCTPDEQMQCLDQIRRHLVDGGLLVLHLDHQDFGWLAGLLGRSEPEIKKGPLLIHPLTSENFRKSYIWTFEPSTQTATTQIHWEKVDDDGNVMQSWAMEPMRLHCAFPFEMEHLLRRAGFSIEAVYGDFFKGELTDKSEQMIWVASNADDTPNERRIFLYCDAGFLIATVALLWSLLVDLPRWWSKVSAKPSQSRSGHLRRAVLPIATDGFIALALLFVLKASKSGAACS